MDGRGAKWAVWLGFGLLIALFGVDFYLDVRERDVFSWMDPYQYYDFARAVLEGHERFDRFEVPSIFPFLLMPVLAVQASVPAALGVQLGFTLLLLWSVDRLCRELGVRTPSPLVAALVLSSPLLIGLSRSLYVEYALSAVVALAFWLWLRFSRTADRRHGLAFGLVFALGFMLKMTFPLFLCLPIAAALVERLGAGRRREALVLLEATLLPLALALAIQLGLFSGSFGYYASLGNTRLPIMRLIGPPEWLSWSSAGFYLRELGRTLLFLLTPLLVGLVLASWRRAGRLGWDALASPRTALWLWLIGPLLLLIVQPVKEPRHVAPCVVPAVLLLVLEIEALPKRGWRAAALGLALGLAAVQYAAVTWGAMEAPYFLDRSLHWRQIGDWMTSSDDPSRYARTRPDLRPLHWKYDHNIAIAGFPANEALALTWQAFPAVVFDLDTLDDAQGAEEIPYRSFQDLYVLTAFNTYNRRIGWRHYYRTLSREQIVANADFVIVNDAGPEELAERFPEHALMASIERKGGVVRILRSSRPATEPYRALYAREFLARHPGLPADELRVVASELLMAAALSGDAVQVRALLREFPFLRDAAPEARNIYWIGGYPVLRELSDRLLRVQRPELP